jgi:hypothetical protein
MGRSGVSAVSTGAGVLVGHFKMPDKQAGQRSWLLPYRKKQLVGFRGNNIFNFHKKSMLTMGPAMQLAKKMRSEKLSLELDSFCDKAPGGY